MATRSGKETIGLLTRHEKVWYCKCKRNLPQKDANPHSRSALYVHLRDYCDEQGKIVGVRTKRFTML